MSTFKIKDVKFQYGNYNRYYGYRNQNFTKDPRLSCFKAKWFEGQDVLDIGCNVGHVTLTIARDFNPRKIIGIDIDDNLIKSAKHNIKHYVNGNQVIKSSLKKRLDIKVISKQYGDKSDINELSFKKPSTVQPKEENEKSFNKIDGQVCINERELEKVGSIEQSNELKSSDESSLSPVCTKSSQFVTTSSSSSSIQTQSTFSSAQPDSSSTEENLACQLSTNSDNKSPIPSKRIKLDPCKPSNFPRNVKFFCQNYVLDSDELLKQEKAEFDCILCLSVTKWIHLNFGDDGLKRVFKRMYSQLQPGGKLILEPQPWCSYKKKKIISECTLKNFLSIKFKPDHFNDYLLSKEVGFISSEILKTPEHESKGFRRPIFLFIKAEESS